MPSRHTSLNMFVVVALVLVFGAICGYHIYGLVLVQLAKNAEHKRLISRTKHGKA